MAKSRHGESRDPAKKSAMSDRTFASPSASALQRHLGGIDYPRSKREIMDYARQRGATDAAIESLDRFEDREYRSAAEVSQEFGRIR
ncbi:MAG: DUF2795 domain-containing protein [Methanomicrobiales archaeon]|nr:DUF2795 domain-containing protein [Methanomicrobiales archaeon]